MLGCSGQRSLLSCGGWSSRMAVPMAREWLIPPFGADAVRPAWCSRGDKLLAGKKTNRTGQASDAQCNARGRQEWPLGSFEDRMCFQEILFVRAVKISMTLVPRLPTAQKAMIAISDNTTVYSLTTDPSADSVALTGGLFLQERFVLVIIASGASDDAVRLPFVAGGGAGVKRDFDCQDQRAIKPRFGRWLDLGAASI
jgi:hypothetical protein